MLLLINTSPHGIKKHNSIELLRLKDAKIKRIKVRVMYYSNHTASLQLTLSGDIEKSPGPGLPKLKCNVCEKTVRSNQKRYECTHALCIKQSINSISSQTAIQWLCDKCLHNVLRFRNVKDLMTCLLYRLLTTLTFALRLKTFF